MYRRKSQLTLFFVSLLTASLSAALPQDSKQGIVISADKLSQTPMSGGGEKIELYGNAIITQGSRKISGLKIVIFRKDSTYSKVIATGKPALFTQKTSVNKDPVSAHANEIQYLLAKDSLLLREDAVINQQGSIIRSDIINYDMTTESVSASRINQQSPRVKIVLEPNTIENEKEHNDTKQDDVKQETQQEQAL